MAGRLTSHRAKRARRVLPFNRRTALEWLERRDLLAFGLTTSTNSYTVDVGANLVFSVARTTAGGAAVGDLTSMLYSGTQLEAPFSVTDRYSHYESGLSSSTVVTATVDPSGNWIMITCNDTSGTGIIQYYIGRKGFNNIYMATYTAVAQGEMRFITYTNHMVLTNAPAPSNLTGNTGAIESTDVDGFANGQTASKYYGEYPAIDAQNYGLTGGGFGVFMDIGNRETDAGGPFFQDIDFQTTSSSSTELYNYMFSSHSQTEFSDSADSQTARTGLYGPYALEFTTGGAPAAVDYSFIAGLNLQGYVSASGRGTVTGTASGVPAGHQVTVALSNGVGQYWGTPNPTTGAYTISGVKPGTYVETLYQDELAVATQAVTITAGGTTTANIADALFSPSEVFLIGSWDGTPNGFLNSDNFPDMHPSDVRMSPWGTFTDSTDTTAMTNYIVGTSTADDWPMAEWKEATTDPTKPIDNINEITFTLTAAQVVNSTLRIGLTRAASARPIINVNGGSFSAAPAISPQATGRGVTLGNFRGNNITYTYSISASALHVGTNTIEIEVASGSSSGSPWLGPSIIYDAVDLVPTSSMTNAPKATSVSIVTSNPSVPLNGQQAFVAIVKDQFGNPMPEAQQDFSWSTTVGSINEMGLYTAAATSGSGTVTVNYFDTASNSTKTATINITNNAAPTVATAAAANPNPVTGISTALSVLGADDFGESNLSYTWTTTGTPPASVNFSATGTNAAKNVTATFSRAGTYNFQVSIVDAGGLSITSSMSVVVNQTLTSISVLPGNVSLTDGKTQTFAATGFDQFGNTMSVQPSLTWSLGTGSVGTIDSTGKYTAPLSPVGTATVRATSGAISGSATVTVTYLKGDINLDGHRDMADVTMLMGTLANLGGYQTSKNLSNQDLLSIADIDGDGNVTNADLQALLNLLLSGGGSTSSEGNSASASNIVSSQNTEEAVSTTSISIASNAATGTPLPTVPAATVAAVESNAPATEPSAAATALNTANVSQPTEQVISSPTISDVVTVPLAPATETLTLTTTQQDSGKTPASNQHALFQPLDVKSLSFADDEVYSRGLIGNESKATAVSPSFVALAQADRFFADFAPDHEALSGTIKQTTDVAEFSDKLDANEWLQEFLTER